MGRIKEFERKAKLTRSVLGNATWRNCIKLSKGIKAESLPCKITKFWLAHYTGMLGLDYYTEASFGNGSGRADFIIEQFAIVFEILGTEKLKDVLKKKYPLPVIPLPADIDPLEIKDMLFDLVCLEGNGFAYYQKLFIERLGGKK